MSSVTTMIIQSRYRCAGYAGRVISPYTALRLEGSQIYGKVFDTIYDGTLYGHWEAIVTLQQMIVLSSADGVVDMTPQTISARTSIPIDIITKGVKVLSEPDQFSRTPGNEGRRIVLLDDHRPWGWRLVNHGKYRALRDMAAKRAADRDRISEKRRENSDVAISRHPVADVAHADADADATTKRRGGATARRTSLPEDFVISERVRKWATEKGFDSLLDQHLEKFISSVKARGARYVDWDEAFINCIRDDWGDIRRRATGGKNGANWWATEDGILAKAKELGLTPRGGESWANLKGRINATIEARA